MYSIAQRLNVLFSYLIACVGAACVLISLTSITYPTPRVSVTINQLDIVYGKALWHADRRNQDFVETSMDVAMDLTPLFRWNTKQVLISVAGAYASPRRADNEVTFWDKLVTARDSPVMELRDVRNRFGFREVSRTFNNISSIDLVLRWNVMPYVGFAATGAETVLESVPLPPAPEVSAKELKYLRY